MPLLLPLRWPSTVSRSWTARRPVPTTPKRSVEADLGHQQLGAQLKDLLLDAEQVSLRQQLVQVGRIAFPISVAGDAEGSLDRHLLSFSLLQLLAL